MLKVRKLHFLRLSEASTVILTLAGTFFLAAATLLGLKKRA
ncbi:MAG: LPXTG cell wall anchor domain-containing protein [Streptococcus sp.]